MTDQLPRHLERLLSVSPLPADVITAAEAAIRQLISRNTAHKSDELDKARPLSPMQPKNMTFAKFPEAKTLYIGSGCFNTVWLVKAALQDLLRYPCLPPAFALRKPKVFGFGSALTTHQVNTMKYLAESRLNVPVPEIYGYSIDPDNQWIALEYIDGRPLHLAWKHIDECGKAKLAEKLAKIIVNLAEIRLPIHESDTHKSLQRLVEMEQEMRKSPRSARPQGLPS